jgi:hypothetical protein
MVLKPELRHARSDIWLKLSIADDMGVSLPITLDNLSKHVEHQERILLLGEATREEDVEPIGTNNVDLPHTSRVELTVSINPRGYNVDPAWIHVITRDGVGQMLTRHRERIYEIAISHRYVSHVARLIGLLYVQLHHDGGGPW